MAIYSGRTAPESWGCRFAQRLTGELSAPEGPVLFSSRRGWTIVPKNTATIDAINAVICVILEYVRLSRLWRSKTKRRITEEK